MVNKNNWCCEITTNTFKLFQAGGIYDDTCERGCIFFYWKQIGIDKQFCEKCQKLCEEERTRLEKDSKEEMEWPKKEREKWQNCANCKGKINWEVEKGHIECREYGDKNWDKWGIFGSSVCQKHQSSYCEDETCSSVGERAYCSEKCMNELEDQEEKQHWLQKATIRELNEEKYKKEKNSIKNNC